MSCYRCSQCSTDWPPTSEFVTCPECEVATRSGSDDPIPVAEAKSRLLHAQFESYYADRESKQLACDLEHGSN